MSRANPDWAQPPAPQAAENCSTPPFWPPGAAELKAGNARGDAKPNLTKPHLLKKSWPKLWFLYQNVHPTLAISVSLCIYVFLFLCIYLFLCLCASTCFCVSVYLCVSVFLCLSILVFSPLTGNPQLGPSPSSLAMIWCTLL